jgi:hypothetical protein
MKWSPEHFILIGILAGCFALVCFGFDGEIKSVIALSTGVLVRSLVTLGQNDTKGD